MADPSSYRPATGVDPDPAGRLPVPRRPRPGDLRRQGQEPPRPGCRRTSRTSATCTRAPPRWSPRAASVEWTVVNTEVEALQLEYSWIKEFDPRFNVKYRDDKSYPWLAVTVGEEFPRVMVGRGAKRKGTRYFGPYSHAWAIRETVDLLLRVFPMRSLHQRRLQALRPDRPAVPARLHRQVRGALRRQRDRRGAPRRSSTTSATSWPARPRPFVKRIEKEMYAASEAPGLREGGPAPRRPRRAQPGAGEAGGGARRRHRRRRDRAGRGPARGRGADLLRPRRPDPRPARLGGRPGRRGRHRRAGRGLPAPALRRRDRRRDPARDPGAGAAAGRRRRSSSCSATCAGSQVSIRVPQRGDKKTLQETVARNALQALALHKTKRASDLTTRNRALEEIQEALELPRCRCGSSATTSPTSRAPRWSPRWWSSRTAWPARASTAAS